MTKFSWATEIQDSFILDSVVEEEGTRILMLQNNNEEFKETNEERAQIFIDDWRSIMTTNGRTNFDLIHELFPQIISDRENQWLLRIPTEEEIPDVIKSLNPWKAPGPDGFNGHFYKKTWNTTGQAISTFVQKFFEDA